MGWTLLNDSSCSCHLHGAAAAPAACKRPLRNRRDVLVIALFLLTCCCLGSVWKVSQNRLHSKQVAAATSAEAAAAAAAATAAAAAAVKPSKEPLSPETVWQMREAIKASMPRTTYFEGWTVDTLQKELPIWVLSLARAKDRREAIIKELKAAGVKSYQIIDAVDARANTTMELHALLKKYANTWKRHMWYRRQQQYRSKIAIDMSHFRMLERIAASNRSTLILEDDAQLTGERWLPDLLTALKELPEDWDIMYLNVLEQYLTRGRAVSPHLMVVRKTPGGTGFVITPGFAQQALDAAKDPKHGGWFDLLFEYMELDHKVQAYIAEPPLFKFTAFPTTVDQATEGVAAWEQEWFAALHT